MLLLLNVLLDDGKRRAPSGRTKIRVRPQRRQLPFEHGKFLAQKPGGPSLDQLHQSMDAQLRIDTYQQMDMIEHHFEFFNLGVVFFADLANDLFQPIIDRRHEHLPPVFGTPDHMIVTSIEHVPVALVGRLIHKMSIQHCAIYVKSVCSRWFPAPSPPKGTRPSSPWMNHRGFRARSPVNRASRGDLKSYRSFLKLESLQCSSCISRYFF